MKKKSTRKGIQGGKGKPNDTHISIKGKSELRRQKKYDFCSIQLVVFWLKILLMCGTKDIMVFRSRRVRIFHYISLTPGLLAKIFPQHFTNYFNH